MTRLKFLFFLLMLAVGIDAQTISGVIVDETTGDSIPAVSIQYKGVCKQF